MVDDQWTAFLQRMARKGSKPYTGTAPPSPGYEKRLRETYRKMLRDALADQGAKG